MSEFPVVLDSRVVAGSGGGPDKTILNSPRYLATEGYRMLCAYMHPPGDAGFEQLRRKALIYRAPLISVPDRGPWDWTVFRELLRICRRERVAIWHGHDYKSNLIGLLLRPFWPMRLVTTVHGWVHYTRRTHLYYGIDRLCLPRYDSVICVSDDLRDRCLACGVTEDRCLLIENAIDIGEFTRTQSTAEAKVGLGLPPDRLVIGAVGRLSAEKGFDVLIRAADRLLNDGLDVTLLIGGEGDQQAELEGLIAELGRADRIRLLGYQSDIRSLFQSLDVFALSSFREGLPNVLLEAMAMEVPVAATRVAGIPLVIHHGKNGLLVEPGSVEDLTQALASLLRDAGLRSMLRREARRTIEESYGFEARIQKIRAVYDVLLGRSICSPA